MKLFVTGTDTGIGKTWVSALLAAHALNLGKSVTYYKPIQTGSPPGEPPEDPQFISEFTQGQVKTHCRYCFEPPVTPSVADVHGVIRFEQIAQDVADYGCQADILLVEGAGGLAVPISSSTLMIDLIEYLHIPVVLVAHCRLGTINHTLLSLQALQARDIPIAGIVINFFPQSPATEGIAVQTLLPTLRVHVPSHIPILTCPRIDEAPPLTRESLCALTQPLQDLLTVCNVL